MDWFENINKWYNAMPEKLWTEPMVRNAVGKGKITAEQYTQITGQDY